MLCYVILYYIILYCIVLYCIILYYIILYYIILYLYYIILYHIAFTRAIPGPGAEGLALLAPDSAVLARNFGPEGVLQQAMGVSKGIREKCHRRRQAL